MCESTSDSIELDLHGFFPMEKAEQYCQTRRWKPYPYRDRHQIQGSHRTSSTFCERPDQTLKPEESRRRRDPGAELWDAAWHCSYCFGKLQELVDRVQSFSHLELDRPEFTDRAKILHRVRYGIGMFDRGVEKFDRVDFNKDVPRCLLANNDRFAYTLDRDPLHGNLEDFEESDLIESQTT